jgi:hypothetical protein
MGMHGTIVLLPTKGSPPTDPGATARKAITVFEKLGLFLPGTIESCKKADLSFGRFADALESGEINPEDYALYNVEPQRLLAPLRELVFVMNTEGYDEPGEIEFPYVEFSVIKKRLPVTCGYDGSVLGNTWATIEFSYGDCRYDPEIHKIRTDRHLLFTELTKVFGSPMLVGVDIG